MARIAGINIPMNKHVSIGLTHIFGIGRSRALEILESAGIAPTTKVKDLTDAEVGARPEGGRDAAMDSAPDASTDSANDAPIDESAVDASVAFPRPIAPLSTGRHAPSKRQVGSRQGGRVVSRPLAPLPRRSRVSASPASRASASARRGTRTSPWALSLSGLRATQLRVPRQGERPRRETHDDARRSGRLAAVWHQRLRRDQLTSHPTSAAGQRFHPQLGMLMRQDLGR